MQTFVITAPKSDFGDLCVDFGLCVLQLRDADAVRELLTDAQQRTAQLQADLMQARQDTQQASLAYQRERVGSELALLHQNAQTYGLAPS